MGLIQDLHLKSITSVLARASLELLKWDISIQWCQSNRLSAASRSNHSSVHSWPVWPTALLDSLSNLKWCESYSKVYILFLNVCQWLNGSVKMKFFSKGFCRKPGNNFKNLSATLCLVSLTLSNSLSRLHTLSALSLSTLSLSLTQDLLPLPVWHLYFCSWPLFALLHSFFCPILVRTTTPKLFPFLTFLLIFCFPSNFLYFWSE